MKTTEILIHIDTKYNTYILNISWNREVYKALKEAKFYAVDEGRRFCSGCLKKSAVTAVKSIKNIKKTNL